MSGIPGEIVEVPGLCYICGKDSNLMLDGLYYCGVHFGEEMESRGIHRKRPAAPPMIKPGHEPDYRMCKIKYLKD